MSDTRLQAFLKANEIKPAQLTRESGISRRHLLYVRKGMSEPTRRVMIALAEACSRLLRRSVMVSHLFDLGEGKRP